MSVGYYNADSEFSTQTQTSTTPVDIRVVQRKARKYVTTCAGLPEELNFNKVLSALKQSLQCGGSIQVDKETELKILVLNGDKRQGLVDFLTAQKIVTKDNIVVHGF
jgi:translation initiation factor SUI1